MNAVWKKEIRKSFLKYNYISNLYANSAIYFSWIDLKLNPLQSHCLCYWRYCFHMTGRKHTTYHFPKDCRIFKHQLFVIQPYTCRSQDLHLLYQIPSIQSLTHSLICDAMLLYLLVFSAHFSPRLTSNLLVLSWLCWVTEGTK